jgi:hypothetical protein
MIESEFLDLLRVLLDLYSLGSRERFRESVTDLVPLVRTHIGEG